jgi:hypothetical protein
MLRWAVSNARWNIQALRDHLRAQGFSSSDPVVRAIRSVGKMVDVFHFNSYEAKDALKGFFKEGDQVTDEHLKLVFGVGERQKDFAYARRASEAHLLGALLAVRSIYDLFSQVVNFLLLSLPLAERACNIHAVRDALQPGRLRGELDELLASDWFRYVNGFVNLSKHRYMIEHGVNVSFVDNVVGVQVSGFSYKDDTWPAKSATEVLQGAFEVKNKVVECGRALNAAYGVPE